MDTDLAVSTLRLAYRRGRLVPFIGGGMSMPIKPGKAGLPGWDGLVAGLLSAIDDESRATSEDRIVRADRAAARLRATGRLTEVIRAVFGKVDAIPPQTVALASLRCPLVISTNYDDLYVAAASPDRASDRQESPVVLGRNPSDCHRVLRALAAPDHPVLWAIQGYVGGQSPKATIHTSTEQRLADEVVVGHAEYRRVANAQPYFRRSFAEVFRQRTLLFIGSSLERYLLDMFSEVIELLGPSPLPHFAVFSGDDCDAERRDLTRTHGIHPVFLPEHTAVPEFLQSLSATRARLTQSTVVEEAPRLSVAASRIPLEELPVGEWRVFSLGGQPDLPQSKRAQRRLGWRDEYAGHNEFVQFPAAGTAPLYRNRTTAGLIGVYARAAGKHDSFTDDLRPIHGPVGTKAREMRDLRVLPPAVVTVMATAAREHVARVHLELLAGGDRRTFPSSFTLMQMIRGWALWKAGLSPGGVNVPDLVIHLDPDDAGQADVIRDLESGRIDCDRLVEPGLVQFWIDVPTRVDEHEWTPVVHPPTQDIWSVLRELFPITRDDDGDWSLTVEPEPTECWQPWPLTAIRAWEDRRRDFIGQPDLLMNLTTFGVVPYSVLHVERTEVK